MAFRQDFACLEIQIKDGAHKNIPAVKTRGSFSLKQSRNIKRPSLSIIGLQAGKALSKLNPL